MSEVTIGVPLSGPDHATGVEPGRAAPFDTNGGKVPSSAPRSLGNLVGADLIALIVSLTGTLVAVNAADDRPLLSAVGAVVYLPIYLAAMASYGLYRRGRRRLMGSSFPDASHLLHSLVVAGLVTVVVSGPAHEAIAAPTVGVLAAMAICAVAFVSVTQCRAVARALAGRYGASGTSCVLVVGSGVVAGQVMSRLHSVNDLQVVGWVDDNLFAPGPDDAPAGYDQLGTLDDLAEVVRNCGVDHVVVAFSPAAGSTLAALLRDLSAEVRISIVPRLFDLLSVRSHVDDLRGLPVMDVAPPALGPADRFAKRLLDLTVSITGLLLLSPLLAIVTLAVKVSSPGPVLFSQDRTGRGGRTFRIHKFRTMVVAADSEKSGLSNDVDGPLFKSRCDPRVTTVGRFLRQTSIDELPQLLNVVKGEMSLVGPRPFILRESDEIQGWAAKRFDVRPGMTGLWQVSGRSDLPFDELCRLDYSYVSSWSLWWDLRILWQTPSAVTRRHGAY